ncbi:MAG: uroporphyrinogen decarboxylase family protein [Planctomycetota bacterium]
MGYDDGWAALNLEMPRRIPRTEYSVGGHTPLLNAVTGAGLTDDSPPEARAAAFRELMRIWDFGFCWSVAIGNQYFGTHQTDMGHAEYAEGGSDRRDTVHCPYREPEDVLAFDPLEALPQLDRADLVQLFEDRYRANCEGYPDAVHMSGTYTTMFSGFIALFGWDMLLLAGGVDPEGLGRVAARYEAWIRQFFEAYAETDIPVMMVHDDIVWTSGAVFAPDWYRAHIFPAYKRLWQPVLDAGKIIVYTSDGDYTEFFDDIVDCGARALVMEPMCDMAAFAAKYGKTHGFIGNADTRILLSGDRAAIRAEVERCVAIGRDCPGFFMAVGNHIPPNTPVENALYYEEVFDELRTR